MSHNSYLGKCKNCDQDYCKECSSQEGYDGWQDFCCDGCKWEYEQAK